MRVLTMLLGAAFVMSPGLAFATTVFDSVNNLAPGVFNSGLETSNQSWDWIDPTANGSNASEFSVAYAQTLTSVSLELSADAPDDGGSILVVLIPDNSGSPYYTTTPDAFSNSGTIATFTDATVIGSILDSSLSQTAALITLNTSLSLEAGNYWIGTETDVVSGNSDDLATEDFGSGQWWWTQPDASVPETNNFNSGANVVGPFAVGGPDNPGGYELIVDTSTPAPEPATIAILGTGLAGLGYFRRRKAKKA